MTLKVKDATTNREYTLDTAIVGLPEPGWIAYNHDTKQWITDDDALAAMMAADEDYDVSVPVDGITGPSPIHGDADCVECQQEIKEGSLAVMISGALDPNGEQWMHYPPCTACGCGHPAGEHIPVQAGPHRGMNGECGSEDCGCREYVRQGERPEQEFFRHLDAAYRVWVHGQDFMFAPPDVLAKRTDLTVYQGAWLQTFEELTNLTKRHGVQYLPDCYCCGKESIADYSTLNDGHQEAACEDCVARLIAEGRYIETADGPTLVDGQEEPEPGCYADEDEDEDEEEPEADEPDEDAITTLDDRKFYQYGKLVLTIGEDEDREEALIAYMDRAQFWPDAWSISDHGNAHRIDLTEKRSK